MEPLEDFISKFLCRIDKTKVLSSVYLFFRPVIIFALFLFLYVFLVSSF